MSRAWRVMTGRVAASPHQRVQEMCAGVTRLPGARCVPALHVIHPQVCAHTLRGQSK